MHLSAATPSSRAKLETGAMFGSDLRDPTIGQSRHPDLTAGDNLERWQNFQYQYETVILFGDIPEKPLPAALPSCSALPPHCPGFPRCTADLAGSHSSLRAMSLFRAVSVQAEYECLKRVTISLFKLKCPISVVFLGQPWNLVPDYDWTAVVPTGGVEVIAPITEFYLKWTVSECVSECVSELSQLMKPTSISRFCLSRRISKLVIKVIPEVRQAETANHTALVGSWKS